MFRDKMHIEWEAWQVVCKLLRETGAVTEEDMKKSRSTPDVTPGQKLCTAITTWGDELAALRVEQATTCPAWNADKGGAVLNDGTVYDTKPCKFSCCQHGTQGSVLEDAGGV